MTRPIGPLLLVFLAFTAYTVWVAVGHGPVGFIGLAWREPWAMQMLLDLAILVLLLLVLVAPDARARRLPFWPFAAATVLLGSVGALAYFVVRAIKGPPTR